MRMYCVLHLSFDEVHDHIVQGLHKRELSMYMLGRVHKDKNEVLGNILDYIRWDIMRVNFIKQQT